MKDGQSTLAPDDSLSQADIILPSQYFESVGSAGLSGEQRLMLAVLVDAINVLQSWQGGGSARKRRDFGEAAQWVNTRGTRHPFSFDSVCDALEIDPELLRSHLGVLTVRSANSTRRRFAHLRLKELSRGQRMTATRLRRHEHVSRIVSAPVAPGPESFLPWDGREERAQDCTAETSSGVAAFGQSSTTELPGRSVSW